MRFWILVPLLFFISCQDDAPVKNNIAVKKDSVVIPHRDTISHDTVSKVDSVPPRIYSELEKQLLADSLVDIFTLDTTIRVELRYSTTNNFMGMDLYGDFDKCFLQPDVAQKLVKAQQALKAKHPFYSLIVYDAVRPLHIQRMMWDTLKLPPGEKQKYLSNPLHGSLHNYGAAVDVSIVDENGIPLDMGTPFDFFGEKAHPEKEKMMLDSGLLTKRQVMNRELLRSVMRAGGFWGIQTEWWHFNSCRRAEAAERYGMVE